MKKILISVYIKFTNKKAATPEKTTGYGFNPLEKTWFYSKLTLELSFVVALQPCRQQASYDVALVLLPVLLHRRRSRPPRLATYHRFGLALAEP